MSLIMKKHKIAHLKKHQEFHQCHMDFYQQHGELFQHQEFQKKHRQFIQDHRSLRFFRPMSVIFNLVILYLLFKWLGIRSISLFFAVFIIVKETLQFSFLRRLEKRIFRPIRKLQNGVEEVAQGNYNVQVESDKTCDLGFIGLLVDSFNEMALKLQAGEKMKQEYEENRKTLIANISHDLKTPITSVQGYLEAILDGVGNSPQKVDKYLRTIYQNTIYIDKLIDDLFLFSKLDMQKLEFNFEVIPIQAFMEDLMEEFKFEMEERNIDFHYQNKMEDDCDLNLDRKRINQAFKNIIGNAVKYGSNKDLVICITMKRNDDIVAIDIEDNGPGIPGDKLPYIFNRFYRIDNERTKDLMSTGLGLAIAKELIQAHGGSITVSSIEQKGTCFSLEFPIVKKTKEGGKE
ncbi:sensor histidine kinase YycG [Desulfosporosinus acididurans]|uniref:histidine kinase n=1 Tax=Desulfosporosinus acididurans TaxID=476652 RepID=A0A0J1FQI7_9FIRM|nr:HAMP domain-containing sensor histidine kinase [Desulfosporosinus acididurans]KLU65547.1 sensor histidine kinase YycG [Desulfosporosinus acididurans]